MIKLVAVCVVTAVSIASAGCTTSGGTAADGPRIDPADIDRLTGPPWVGALTYLDYSSRRLMTIDSSITVRRASDDPPAWEFGFGYSKEPHADSTETIALSRDGRRLGDEAVVSREQMTGGGVRITTEADGNDDSRPARFRFVHTITDRAYTRSKLVRFTDEADFFERHVYRWTR